MRSYLPQKKLAFGALEEEIIYRHVPPYNDPTHLLFVDPLSFHQPTQGYPLDVQAALAQSQVLLSGRACWPCPILALAHIRPKQR